MTNQGFMLLYKTLAASFFFMLFVICPGCRNKQRTADPPVITDTTKILNWKKNYDSFYQKYLSSRDPKYLEEGGVFADSVLFCEQQLLRDNSRRKMFFGLLFYRGLDLNDIHDFVKSHDLLERYISLYSQYDLSQPAELAFAKKTLGNIYSRYGDYKKASLLLQQSLDYNKQVKDTVEIVSCMINISIPLKELGLFNEAEQSLLELLRLSTADIKRKAISTIELADIYLRQNKILQAELEINKAGEFLKLLPQERGRTEVYASLYKIEADWQMAIHEPLQALKAYRRSADSLKIILQNHPNRESGKLYIAMGKAFEKLNFPDSALRFYNLALHTVAGIDSTDNFSLPQQKNIYAENTIAEALYARVDCILAREMKNDAELQNAVNCYKLAFQTERKLLNAFSYDESRLFMVEETKKQSEKAIATCYRLFEKTKDQRWANEAFLFAEHNKAFVLAESVRRNSASSLFLQKDTLYKKIQSLRNSLALTDIEINQKRFSASPDTALIKVLTTGKQKTEEELLAAENNIRIKNPGYSDWMTNEVSLSADEIINKTLLPGTSLIEYFSGDSALFAFTAEKGKPVSFHKLSTVTKKITEEFLHFFTDQNLILNDPLKYAAAANNLFNSILGPYFSQKSSSLLIIPDGFISYIPFDALLTGPAASTNISSFPFLIKQQETFYAFSCKTLLAQAEDKSSATVNSIAAFAPVFAAKERGIAPLLHSSDELDGIRQLYPNGKFYTGNTATLKQFEENASNTGIIHLATHAGLGNDSLDAGIEFYDSTLYLNRIYTLPLKARLVVLSGCETGSGTVNRTEGLMSLARAFSYAGTKNVIGSLWQTEDNTSAEIFKSFYSNLSRSDFSTALHKAKLSVINNANEASASPYYWSGYIYIGSPGEKINQQATGKLKWIAGLTGLVLIIVYFFFKKRKG